MPAPVPGAGTAADFAALVCARMNLLALQFERRTLLSDVDVCAVEFEEK